MLELNSKYGVVKIFTDTVDEKSIGQVIEMANSPLGENAHVRIMPDVHAGAGCVIGTTLRIKDKVCPNLVGVDIGCGVTLVKTDIDFGSRLEELDKVIRTYIPSGLKGHTTYQEYEFDDLYCWNDIPEASKDLIRRALGSLGGGNHFIEAYEGGGLVVHSGSRHLGVAVAKHYQNLTSKSMSDDKRRTIDEAIATIPLEEREAWFSTHKPVVVDKSLMYLSGEYMDAYLHDIAIVQKFANANRHTMLNRIVEHMDGKILEEINSIHNYIDVDSMILRKGSISAREGELLVIPLNMRDGLLVCKGKGNEDWNYSAPHGAGRLYSRARAKELFTVDEYRESMEGIFTTCINSGTLDEAPFVYKDYEEIMHNVEPTVEILERLIPIYNFKAAE